MTPADALGPLRWSSPWAFLLLLPLAVAAIHVWRRGFPALRLGVTPGQGGGSPGKGGLRLWLPYALEALGVAGLILALARPQAGLESSRRRTPGIDVMVALDVSGSMDTVDIPRDARATSRLQRLLRQIEHEDEAVRRQAGRELAQILDEASWPSRLAAAKRSLSALIARRPNDRFGLILFAGTSLTACPPTLDHDFLRQRLADTETGLLGNTSTALAAPIATATSRLRDSQAGRRVVLLLTDGQDSGKSEITPAQAAAAAAEFDVAVHTVSIGSEYGFYPHRNRGLHGRTDWQRMADYDPAALAEIAETTGGSAFRADDEAHLQAVMDEFDRYEPTTHAPPRYTRYAELYPWPAAAGLGLLLAGLALGRTLLLRTP